jgi:lon-related putative ATP-dependent protease
MAERMHEEEFTLAPAPAPLELSPDRLRWRCQPEDLPFETTDDLIACDEIIGQKRAVDAIRQGLEIRSPGYNIFVAGLTGTGKTTTIKQILLEIDRSPLMPGDKCYVNNFRDPDRPLYLALPAGRGSVLKRDMAELIDSLQRDIPQLFESEAFKLQRQQLVSGFSEREQAIVKELEAELAAEKFALIRAEMGPISKLEIVSLIKGEPVRMEELPARAPDLTPEEVDKIRHRHQELSGRLAEALKRSRDLAREARRQVEKLEHEFASEVIDGAIDDIAEKHDNAKVKGYLAEVRTHILHNLAQFAVDEEGEESVVDPFRVYEVNVLVDHSESRGAPIIIEKAPTFKNLFGSIEREAEGPFAGRSDFMMIKAGSILMADGGYLVFNLLDAAHEAAVWPALKRTLKNSSLTIQSYDPFLFFSGSALKPEPIDLNMKVVVIGDHALYHFLYSYEEEFSKIFKVKAEFDSVIPRNASAIDQYMRFLCRLCHDENLPPFDRSGAASLIEEAVRDTGRSDKISTRFSEIADVVREAAHWARQDKAPVVRGEHVDRAVEARRRRVDLIEDKVREMFVDGTVLMRTEGEEVGVVNGLSIFDVGDHVFGQAARISSQTGMGRSGIINIEREADLSGKTHNKGVLILEGYLRSRFAQDKPLSMSASICFEQSYTAVDGDSASSSELYAILSSLAGVPVRQHLAVTGSVNQHGEVQPIGGVNEKIEGFYDVCVARGLKGVEGVLIPSLNEGDLMLRKDVVEAVRAGRFHIYPVRTVDVGLEILTGIKAGERLTDGRYEEGTINYLVDERLADLAEGLREYGEGEAPDEAGGAGTTAREPEGD